MDRSKIGGFWQRYLTELNFLDPELKTGFAGIGAEDWLWASALTHLSLNLARLINQCRKPRFQKPQIDVASCAQIHIGYNRGS